MGTGREVSFRRQCRAECKSCREWFRKCSTYAVLHEVALKKKQKQMNVLKRRTKRDRVCLK